MIMHIVRKDWQLVRPLALLVAGLQIVLGFLEFQRLPFGTHGAGEALNVLVTLALILAMILLVCQIIHQDAIPGVNQDWLVRPIPRGDLLLAKLLSIALYIHGPIILVSLTQCLAHGFQFDDSLRAVLLSNCAVVLVFSLPLAAAAALTKSVTEALVTLLTVALGLLLLHFLVPVLSYPLTRHVEFDYPTVGTGIQWFWRFPAQLILLASLIGVLLLQYFKRDTQRSRRLFVAGFLVLIFLPALPWQPAFRVQQWLSPESASQVMLSHATTADASALPPATAFLSQAAQDKDGDDKAAPNGKNQDGKDEPVISLALSLSSLPKNSILHTDRWVVHLLDAGVTVYRGVGEPFDVAAGDSEALIRTAFKVPRAIFARYAQRPLTLQMQYSLTLLGSQVNDVSLALSDVGPVPGLGECATRVTATGVAEVGCRIAGELPDCLSVRLIRSDGANLAPEKYECSFNYAPTLLRFPLSPTDQFDIRWTLRDSDPAPAARVIFTLHPVKAHLSRSLTIEGFSLKEASSR
jgi:hypothetical protein